MRAVVVGEQPDRRSGRGRDRESAGQGLRTDRTGPGGQRGRRRRGLRGARERARHGRYQTHGSPARDAQTRRLQSHRRLRALAILPRLSLSLSRDMRSHIGCDDLEWGFDSVSSLDYRKLSVLLFAQDRDGSEGEPALADAGARAERAGRRVRRQSVARARGTARRARTDGARPCGQRTSPTSNDRSDFQWCLRVVETVSDEGSRERVLESHRTRALHIVGTLDRPNRTCLD